MIEVPEENFKLFDFVEIPYNGSRYPGKMPLEKFREGSNCQLFVLGVLDSIGFLMDEDMRSSELWMDRNFTYPVGDAPAQFKMFDILFFLPSSRMQAPDPKWFHLGIYLGRIPGFSSEHYVLHNDKPGPSAVWPLEGFEKSPKKYRLVGAKRPFRLKAKKDRLPESR